MDNAATREQLEGLAAFIQTITPVDAAEQSMVDRLNADPEAWISSAVDQMNTAPGGTVDTYDLFSPARIAESRARRNQG